MPMSKHYPEGPIAVVRLTVPVSYLKDTCAGGTWSDDVDDAVWYGSHGEARDAAIAGDCAALADYEQTWDTLAVDTEATEEEVAYLEAVGDPSKRKPLALPGVPAIDPADAADDARACEDGDDIA